MPNHENAMIAYCQLARLAWERRQVSGCDRFLVLAGVSAMRAGWPEVAKRCRELIVQHNPAHLLGRFTGFAEALGSDDFRFLARRLSIWCPFEKAEFLLRGLGFEVSGAPAADESGESAGSVALALLEPC